MPENIVAEKDMTNPILPPGSGVRARDSVNNEGRDGRQWRPGSL